jgi:hypothetical protein
MGYRNTPAHMTKSLARHGGDIVWPVDPGLIIRRGNVDRTSDLPGADLGWAESVGAAAQIASTLATLGKTAYELRQGQMDAKRSRTHEADAQAAAAQEAKLARDAAAAATTKEVTDASHVRIAGANVSTSALVIGGAVALGAVYLFLRRK